MFTGGWAFPDERGTPVRTFSRIAAGSPCRTLLPALPTAERLRGKCARDLEDRYRGTPLARKGIPVGPYPRPMPMVLGGSQGSGRCFMGEVPL